MRKPVQGTEVRAVRLGLGAVRLGLGAVRLEARREAGG